jgi:hypothetical protein
VLALVRELNQALEAFDQIIENKIPPHGMKRDGEVIAMGRVRWSS